MAKAVENEQPKEEQKKAVTTEHGTQEGIARQEPPTPPKTLALLMGDITHNLLAALQGNDAGVKQRAIADGIRQMRIWYDAQPVEGRKDAARLCRKTMENFKLVAEQFFQEMMTISAQDAQ